MTLVRLAALKGLNNPAQGNAPGLESITAATIALPNGVVSSMKVTRTHFMIDRYSNLAGILLSPNRTAAQLQKTPLASPPPQALGEQRAEPFTNGCRQP